MSRVLGRRIRGLRAALGVLLAVGAAVPAGGMVAARATTVATLDPMLSASLQTASPTQSLTLLGELSHVPTAGDIAALKALGAQAAGYGKLPLVALQAPAGLVPTLQGSGLLTGIWQNRNEELLLHESVPLIAADRVRSQLGFDGTGVGIAILDSGIDGTHPDLAYPTHTVQNVLFAGYTKVFANAYFYEENVADTDTTAGHGTHVAGIAAGTGAASGGYYAGVAPGAHLIGIGAGQGEDMIATTAGFDWILRNQQKYNIRVINGSWGDSTIAFDPNDPINVATKAAHDAGIVVVLGAGNSGGPSPAGTPSFTSTAQTYGSMSAYALAPWVVSVGGATKLGQLDASYSSIGGGPNNQPGPTVIAPGTWIASDRAVTGVVTDSNSTPFDLTDPSNPRMVPTQWTQYYTVTTGTSMATPHVSGVAALMLQANPNLTPDQVKSLIAQSATPVAGCPAIMCGTGLVNAYNAVEAALSAADTPPVAVLSARPSSGGSPLTVTLDASQSYDPDKGAIAQYRWDFNGDGAIDAVTTTPTVTTTYTTGRYTAQVIVVDVAGLQSAPAAVTILSDNPPHALASVQGHAKAATAVTLDGSASAASSGATLSTYSWSFGDGTTATGASVSHAWAASAGSPAYYAWKLVVTDNFGRSDATAGTIKVTP